MNSNPPENKSTTEESEAQKKETESVEKHEETKENTEVVQQTINSRKLKETLAHSIDSSDSGEEQVMQQIDEEKMKKKEEQSIKIIEMLRREVEKKERQKQRRDAVLALFKDDAEKAEYGVTGKTVKYMTKKIKEYVKELKIRHKKLSSEEDYVKVDDTWLNLSKMMFEAFRYELQNVRLKQFETNDATKYLELSLNHMQKKREITIKAGEMICTYLELDFQPFIHQRQNEEPTIVEYVDPIQFMIPAPKTSKVIDVMEKELCQDLLKHFVTFASKKIKDNQEIIMIKRK